MTPGGRRVVLVAAVADDGTIGDAGDIPWHLPGEQRLFRELTTGHVLLMGRATHESIGRALPGRTTVVLTRDPGWSDDGVLVAGGVEEALVLADRVGPPGADVVVAGGAQVYAALLEHADEQVLTRVPLSPGGDTRYPTYDADAWTEVRREAHDGFDRVWLHPARTVRAAG